MAAVSVLTFMMLWISIAAFAQSSPTPDGVKADRLGETLSQWTKNNPLSIRGDDIVMENPPRPTSGASVAYCLARNSNVSETFTYGSAPLLTETAWFHGGNLYKIEISFLNDEPLPSLLAALKPKFGKPFSKQTRRVRNGFGSLFEEKSLAWSNRVSTLELSYSTVPGSHVRLRFLLEATQNAAQLKREQRTKACADM